MRPYFSAAGKITYSITFFTHTIIEVQASRSRSMNKEFCIGLAIGMLAGAVIVNNVPKAKQLVDKGQKIVVEKIKSLGKGKKADDHEHRLSGADPRAC